MKLKFFDIAKKMAFKSPSRFKLGCVIVNKNRIVGLGRNHMNKTHPRCKTYGNYVHAELDALIGSDYKETKNAIAYVYRETLNGTLAKSRPCPVCMEALRLAGISQVCYTVENGFHKEVL